MYLTFLKWPKKIWEKTKDFEQFDMTTTQMRWHVLYQHIIKIFLRLPLLNS